MSDGQLPFLFLGTVMQLPNEMKYEARRDNLDLSRSNEQSNQRQIAEIGPRGLTKIFSMVVQRQKSKQASRFPLNA
jgi:hypothetical protein